MFKHGQELCWVILWHVCSSQPAQLVAGPEQEVGDTFEAYVRDEKLSMEWIGFHVWILHPLFRSSTAFSPQPAAYLTAVWECAKWDLDWSKVLASDPLLEDRHTLTDLSRRRKITQIEIDLFNKRKMLSDADGRGGPAVLFAVHLKVTDEDTCVFAVLILSGLFVWLHAALQQTLHVRMSFAWLRSDEV